MPHIKRQLLQRIAIFGALSEATLEFILQKAVEVSCAADDPVFREGDPAEAIYIIESGKVAILKKWEDRQYLLGYLETGDCFGEMALMDMHPRSASVIAVEETLVFKISSAALLELYSHDLEQFALLQMNLGREVSRRLRESDERMFLWRVSPEARSELPEFTDPKSSIQS